MLYHAIEAQYLALTPFRIAADTWRNLLAHPGNPLAETTLHRAGAAAWEIMVGTPAIRNLIREDKVAQMYSSIQTGQNYGMMTLDQHLQDLVKRSLITRQQAKIYAKEKRLFE